MRGGVLLVALLIPACGGTTEKPTTEGDGDTGTDTDADTDTDTDADTDTDTDTGGPYTRAVRAFSITGEATVDPLAATYDGVEVQAFENHVGRLCTVPLSSRRRCWSRARGPDPSPPPTTGPASGSARPAPSASTW